MIALNEFNIMKDNKCIWLSNMSPWTRNSALPVTILSAVPIVAAADRVDVPVAAAKDIRSPIELSDSEYEVAAANDIRSPILLSSDHDGPVAAAVPVHRGCDDSHGINPASFSSNDPSRNLSTVEATQPATALQSVAAAKVVNVTKTGKVEEVFSISVNSNSFCHTTFAANGNKTVNLNYYFMLVRLLYCWLMYLYYSTTLYRVEGTLSGQL